MKRIILVLIFLSIMGCGKKADTDLSKNYKVIKDDKGISNTDNLGLALTRKIIIAINTKASKDDIATFSRQLRAKYLSPEYHRGMISITIYDDEAAAKKDEEEDHEIALISFCPDGNRFDVKWFNNKNSGGETLIKEEKFTH